MSSLRGRDLISAADLSADEIGRLFARATRAQGRVPRRAPPRDPAARAADAGDAVPEAEPADAGHVRGRDDPARRPRDLPDRGRRARRRARRVGDVARNLERFVDAIVVRTGPARGRRGARRPGLDPGHQRPDDPRASRARRWPTCSRSTSGSGDLAGVVLAFVGDGNNVYHSLALMGADARAWRSGSRIRPATGPTSGSWPGRASSRPATGGAARLHRRPARGRRGRGGHLHGRLDVDGPGGRGRGAARRLRRATRSTTALLRGRARTRW